MMDIREHSNSTSAKSAVTSSFLKLRLRAKNDIHYQQFGNVFPTMIGMDQNRAEITASKKTSIRQKPQR